MASGSKIPGYGKVWNLGHPAVDDLFTDEVIVEEKIDGSQFSFAVLDGELHMRSKGAVVFADNPGMFAAGVECAQERQSVLTEGLVYRGEFLQKPHHNGLAYDRVPEGHVMLWDVSDLNHRHMDREQKEAEAARVGLEVTPVVHVGRVSSVDEVRSFMDGESVLGGQKPEGMVFKSLTRFDRDGTILKGKHVSPRFKEVQSKQWAKKHPGGGDVLQRIGEKYRHQARWEKAIMRLRERGELDDSPRDIGALMKEVQQDLDAECAAEIQRELWQWARKTILRKSTAGLPEWYKARLLERQFGGGE